MNHPIKTLIQYSLFPTVITLGTTLMIMAINQQMNVELLAIMIAISTMLIVHVVERWLPYRNSWNTNTGDVKADLTSLALILTVLEPLIKVSTVWITSLLLMSMSSTKGLAIFPNDWPLISQLILFALFVELGRYWVHRLSHTQHHLWRVHASHHSAERLYQFNGYRVHPINHLWNYFLGQFPLILLGAGQEVIMLYFVFSAISAAFQHANIDTKNGILNYVFSTNELHRWHHTTDTSVGNKNFGSVLIIWDFLFGSYYSGKAEKNKSNALGDVGLISPKHYPINNFFKQMAAPFCWQKCVIEDKEGK